MRVLISGAGPAGLTAAYWLRRYGYRPTIVERAPSLLVGGYKIDVRGFGNPATFVTPTQNVPVLRFGHDNTPNRIPR